MSDDPIAERTAQILRHQELIPRFKDLPKAEREELARAQAESDVRAEKRRLAVRAEKERQRTALRQRADAAGVPEWAQQRAEAEQAKRDRAERDRAALAKARRVLSPPARPKRGRSRWTRALFLARLEDATTGTPEPRTDEAIARRFVGLNKDRAEGIEPDSLARLRRKAERGELPEYESG